MFFLVLCSDDGDAGEEESSSGGSDEDYSGEDEESEGEEELGSDESSGMFTTPNTILIALERSLKQLL